MTDKTQRIKITGLKAEALIGAYEFERHKKQPLIIDVEFSIDVSNAIKNDKLEEVIDYQEISQEIFDFVEESQFELIEKLAYEIHSLVSKHESVSDVKIVVNKPLALARFGALASVEYPTA